MPILSIFGKKKESDDLEQKLTSIDRNIANSFSAVKDDFRSMKKWIEHFDETDKKHDEKLYELKGEVRYLREILRDIRDQQTIPSRTQEPSRVEVHEVQHQQKRQPIVEDIIEEEEVQQEPARIDLDQFTDTQKAIFSRLGIIQHESSQEWVPLKHLAQELYPEKQYNDVRSTISEYVGLLSDAGLVNRSRKGKQTFVSVSKKGAQAFSNKKKKVKPKAKR